MPDDDKPFKLFGLDPEAIHQMIRERQLEEMRRCFVTQGHTEQQHRLHCTVLLAAEGASVREQDRFGSIVVNLAVEHVMEGDWDGVLRDIAWCSFEWMFRPRADQAETEPCERERHYAALWSRFRELLKQAHAGRAEGTDGRLH